MCNYSSRAACELFDAARSVVGGIRRALEPSGAPENTPHIPIRCYEKSTEKNQESFASYLSMAEKTGPAGHGVSRKITGVRALFFSSFMHAFFKIRRRQ